MSRKHKVEGFLRSALGANQNTRAETDPKIVFNGPVTINIVQPHPVKKAPQRRVPLDRQALQSSQSNAAKLAKLPPAKWS